MSTHSDYWSFEPSKSTWLRTCFPGMVCCVGNPNRLFLLFRRPLPVRLMPDVVIIRQVRDDQAFQLQRVYVRALHFVGDRAVGTDQERIGNGGVPVGIKRR